MLCLKLWESPDTRSFCSPMCSNPSTLHERLVFLKWFLMMSFIFNFFFLSVIWRRNTTLQQFLNWWLWNKLEKSLLTREENRSETKGYPVFGTGLRVQISFRIFLAKYKLRDEIMENFVELSNDCHLQNKKGKAALFIFAWKQNLFSTWRLAIPVSHKMQFLFYNYLYCFIYWTMNEPKHFW